MNMEFLVLYGANWDGGAQERDATIMTIEDIYPDAVIKSKCDNYGSTVKIFAINGNNTQEIFSCPQRDMFRKYNWPARPKMTQALMKLK